MARPVQPGDSSAVRTIGVGMLGYAFMGKAHSNAYKTLSYMTWPPGPAREAVRSLRSQGRDRAV